jgi:hypothetical protein
VDAEEIDLVTKYAIGLGFTSAQASKVISRSIAIFGGGIDFEDYHYLISK